MGERTTQESTGVREGRHWEKQANCLSERGKISLEKAQVINSRASENKAIYNQSLETILLEAHTPVPYKIVKNQDKLGSPHPAAIFLLYNSLKDIWMLSRQCRLLWYPCSLLLYPPKQTPVYIENWLPYL